MKHRSTTILLALAGLAWTAGQAVLPDMGADWSDRLTAVAASPVRQSAAIALLILAGGLLVLGAVAAARVPRQGRGARLTSAGVFLLGLGGIWLAAGRGAFSMAMARAAAPEVPTESGVAMMSAAGGFEFIALLPCLPALLLGPILIAVGRRRAVAAGWLPLVLWVVGIGTFIGSEFSSKVGESVGIGVAAVGLGLLGRALARP